ncbi:MAG: hypothetical protein ABJB66_19795 [Gemmatimonadaceae bacterium]
MIPSAWLRWGPMRLAVGALGIALVVAIFTFVRAMQLSEVGMGALPVLPNPAALIAPPQANALDVKAVVERDVFAPDRTAPTNSYLLPSEIERDVGPIVTPPPVVVLGIALADSGRSFATAKVGADLPRIVRIGDKIGPYTVRNIEVKRVTFALANGKTQIVAALTSGN